MSGVPRDGRSLGSANGLGHMVCGPSGSCCTREMHELGRREQAVLRMRRQGATFEDIGELLGIGPDTARRDWERASGSAKGWDRIFGTAGAGGGDARWE